jgi:Dyp-type peroxidase family
VSRWEDIQGNILRGYASHRHAAYVLAAITDADAARGMLGRLVADGRIAGERDWKAQRRPPSRLNVAFTYPGLQQLEVDLDAFEPFEDFRSGMYARARQQLGDRGANDPDNWTEQLAGGAHVLFTIYGHTPGARTDELGALEAELRAGGMEVVCVQSADTLPGTREHFGFRDGFSQPSLSGVSDDRRLPRGEGVKRRWPRLFGERWRDVRLGEFVLGYRDEDGVVPGGRDPLLTNGTFMVWRKLEQHVDVFDDWIRAWAGESAAAQELLKARIVGRWPEGVSLVRHPARAHAEPRGAERRHEINDFAYGSNDNGLSCPLGAHVRRSNPRDALGFRTERTRRNRIIRRGMPYTETDPPARGLIFVCFNASIGRQFEQIQGNWLMQGDTFGLGADRDFLIGGLDADQPVTRMTIQGDQAEPPVFLLRDRQFVTVRGGYYLFVPGLRALSTMTAR